MNKGFLLIGFLIASAYVHADCTESLLTKDILPYFKAVEGILNDEAVRDLEVMNDFFVIREEWYESSLTKGQWYGKTLDIWFCMGKEREIVRLDETEKRIYYTAGRYDWPGDYGAERDITIIYKIFFKIKGDRIVFMIRNDCWYYTVVGTLRKDTAGKFRMYDLSEKAFPHD
ncbi:MAG: hypothetical protein JW881_20960 [Spirochaetales bacterium]|nr:hypothetical protein [Spirochaetales bacterium]